MARTAIQRRAAERELEVRRRIGGELRTLREDAGLTRAAVAEAAGIERSYVSRIEAGQRQPSIAVLTALATALGADLAVRAYPTTGPLIRDRIQAAMIETLLAVLHPRWTATPEVPVHRPARGVIDLVLTDRREPVGVASEVHSQLLRLEQQVRWHREKEESLPSAELWRFATADGQRTTSRLLVLRSTAAARDVASTYERTLAAAYPARASDAVAALTTASATWPGPAVVWMRVVGRDVRLLDEPPRGVRLGR